MNLIICLGGTGQLVLHYYAQWYLLGLPEASHGPLRAVVIDQDEVLPSLAALRNLFDLSSKNGTLINGEPAPRLLSLRMAVDDGRAVRELLGVPDETRASPGRQATHHHPALAFFDKATLNQKVRKGFYALPCLAPTLWPRYADTIERDLQTVCQAGEEGAYDNIVVVGSVIGGSGGGFLLPVLDLLKRVSPGSKLSTVLFAPWFLIEGEKDKDIPSLSSNAHGVIATLLAHARSQSHFPYHRMVFLKGTVKKPPHEGYARQLPWPEDGGHPLAEACGAIAAILADNIDAQPVGIRLKSVEPSQVEESFHRLGKAAVDAVAGIDFLVEKRGIERAAEDVFRKQIWGRNLCQLIESFWHASAEHGPTAADHNLFPSQACDALRSLYLGEGKSPYGIRDLFQSQVVKPGMRSLQALARRLPPAKTAYLPEDQVAQRMAASLLLFLLRGSGT